MTKELMEKRIKRKELILKIEAFFMINYAIVLPASLYLGHYIWGAFDAFMLSLCILWVKDLNIEIDNLKEELCKNQQ